MLKMLVKHPCSRGRIGGRILSLAFALALLSPGLISCGGNSTSSTPGSGSGSGSGSGGGSVSLAPGMAAVTTSQSQTFTATISGNTGTISWFVDGVANGNAAVGAIAADGDTTATYSPSATTTPGNHSVTAQVSGGTMSPAVTAVVTDLDAVFTHHNDNGRTGQNVKEYALSPTTVSATTFGKLFSCTLDSPGYVYAEPLYVANFTMNDGKKHNVVFVVTESDWVYAFDADSGSCRQLWKKSMLAPGETTVPFADTGELDDLTPEIGITSTPAIDVDAGLIYVCAKSKDVNVYFHRLHALTLASGAEPVGPVLITAPNFVPLFHLQRPALMLNNGTVYVAFGSHGDNNTYQGWLMGYNATTLAQEFVWSSTDPTSGNNEGAIWQSGGGPAFDDAGNVYLETANGTFDANSGGINYSDSVMKLSGSGTVLDYFTPSNESLLALDDADLGSSPAMVLPNSVGSGAHPHLLLATGKPGYLFLLDRDHLGTFNSVLNQDVQEVPVLPNTQFKIGGGVFGSPAYWNGNIYVAANTDFLKHFTISNGTISATPISQSAGPYNRRGTSPSVSANGTTGGIVWAVDISGYPSASTPAAPAILNAYDATNLGHQLYSSPTSGAGAAGLATKFTVPTVANGKVYVGTQGQLDVFGLIAK
jgi:hypothetical protein